jgi:hypothetical protein
MNEMIVIIDILLHLLIGLFLTIALWPYLGSISLIAILGAAAFLINAGIDTDSRVAAKAGFRRLTLVQCRYVENLGIAEEVLTHPSLLPVVGTLASSKHRIILLTAGVFAMCERKELSEDDFRRLCAKLASRDAGAVSAWTFHLGTGGARLFSRLDKEDPNAGYWRRTLTVALIGGTYSTLLGVIFAASIGLKLASDSGNNSRAIDISALMPAFWLPPVLIAFVLIWKWLNAALMKPAVGDWNSPITLEKVTFLPMQKPISSHPNLNLLRPGFLMAGRRRSKEADRSL